MPVIQEYSTYKIITKIIQKHESYENVSKVIKQYLIANQINTGNILKNSEKSEAFLRNAFDDDRVYKNIIDILKISPPKVLNGRIVVSEKDNQVSLSYHEFIVEIDKTTYDKLLLKGTLKDIVSLYCRYAYISDELYTINVDLNDVLLFVYPAETDQPYIGLFKEDVIFGSLSLNDHISNISGKLSTIFFVDLLTEAFNAISISHQIVLEFVDINYASNLDKIKNITSINPQAKFIYISNKISTINKIEKANIVSLTKPQKKIRKLLNEYAKVTKEEQFKYFSLKDKIEQ